MNIFNGNLIGINTLSGSIEGTFAIYSGSFSGSFSGNGSGLTGISSTVPGGTVSGSEQLTGSYDQRYERKGTGILSSSAQISSDISGSFVSLSGSLVNRIYSIELTTGSLNAFSGSIQSQVNSILLTTGSLNLYSGSANNRFASLELTSGSLNVITGSILNRLSSIELTSGSLNVITGSILNRLSSIEIVTSSYTTTGSNTFRGIEIISGSVTITGSLSVIGTISGSYIGDGSGLTGVIASASPAGSNKTIQFNDSGTTSGSNNFTFDKASNVAYLTGSLIATSITSSLQGTASYFPEVKTFGITIDGGGSVITTGVKGDITIPFNCTVNSWFLTADQAGSIVIDIWKDTLANFPPTVADTIAGTEKPTLSGVAFNSDTSFTTFTGSISANDVIRFNVDSVATVTRVNLVLKAII